MMAEMDVSEERSALLNDKQLLKSLPSELLQIVQDYTSTSFLDAIATAALIPELTDRIFGHFTNIFPDICARWVLSLRDAHQQMLVVSAFARILPFAPHLSVFLEPWTRDARISLPGGFRSDYIHELFSQEAEDSTSDKNLVSILLAVWRLISFKKDMFGTLVSTTEVQRLLDHRNLSIRYLACRLFCQMLHASDFKLESLISERFNVSEPILGDFDGREVDYGFLTLHEHQRSKELARLLGTKCENVSTATSTKYPAQILTSMVIAYGKAMLPRPTLSPRIAGSLILTPTTTSNLEGFAKLLQRPEPILLHGLPGSGKTSLVNEIAKALGAHSNMVTLHLNEQTDAKMLIGLYSTDSKPGSFKWRPGVLTTAVKEGRWVLVEDLDRAPTEVISTLLPLVERGELLIPSRGERIQAPSSFRLLATIRTARGMNGQENLPTLLGLRFWQLLSVQSLPHEELREIILGTYPILKKFIPGIISVFDRMLQLSTSSSLSSSVRGMLERQMNLRDVLKWCRRLAENLVAAGCTTGEEAINESTRDAMFMEAVDCFVSSLPDSPAKRELIYGIGVEMHMSKERVEHYLNAGIPQFDEKDDYCRFGRVTYRKKRHSNRCIKQKKTFAATSHVKKLLEKIAVSVKLAEPVLLVGETGIGKTTVIQQLADSLGHKLIAVNLSQQSEVGDLLGGFKPVNVRSLAVPLKEEFEDLFAETGISASKNQKYLEQIGKCFAKGQWSKVSKLWREAPKMFSKIVAEYSRRESEPKETRGVDDQPTKRRKTESKLQSLKDLSPRWEAFSRTLDQFDIQISGGSGHFAFSFVEGNIVKAVRNGDWVLLDEINLASPDTLESIAELLTGPAEIPSILLSETGDIERITAHPDFRIFGAMNPATDVGKRDLPIGIRSRFSEIYVDSPDKDLKDLQSIIRAYLKSSSTKDEQAADDIARLYLNTKRLAEEKRLVDGANEVPHFSLRTLTRVLSYVNDISPFYGLRRALYEGFSMGFLTLLDRESEKMLMPLIHHHIFGRHGNSQTLLSQPPKHPNDGRQYVRFRNKNKDRHYWLSQGGEPLIERPDYIITDYVERNLLNLVRATSTRRFPILIQGPTSSGKTSMIEYLANFTGNKFVRINNHDHTDLQEYLGTYISDQEGKLRFQEGLLVQAMRQGYWIVLDELNLAPTDVLEALNRLLDDNRELLIPETQEVVRPHVNFMLFATQNPPGLYGGRKVLSRAFRNRFLELHFDDIPEDELEYILQMRSQNTSPSDCRRIVSVYKELSRLRQTNRLFEQKDSFATLRDLFRWTMRNADTREEIANNGFMLLAERVRNDEERLAVKSIIETVFKVKILPEQLYDMESSPILRQLRNTDTRHNVVWTHAMCRLYVLVANAIRNDEPVLLVGDTGCGKTTVCQELAIAMNKELHIVNAHQNTETGDLIGSQRPVRNRAALEKSLILELMNIFERLGEDTKGPFESLLQRYHSLDNSIASTIPDVIKEKILVLETKSKALFEWSDGSLVQAMKTSSFFLLDEISLADDSVLERLNSVLEPHRTLLLAEKGVDNSFVSAADGFQFFATMNPGGDFGKKELSPALRNRFTEIWVPPLSATTDIYQIVTSKLSDNFQDFADIMVQFSTWFGATFRSTSSTPFSVREILGWVQFVNQFDTKEDGIFALVHGAATVFIDTLGANPSALLAIDNQTIHEQRQNCLQKLTELLNIEAGPIYFSHLEVNLSKDSVSVGSFSFARKSSENIDAKFTFEAPTTKLNVMRVLRALKMDKPILLEGSPGVGKTRLIEALASACGQALTRINLSDQTDLMDLFGTDVPIEGEQAGNFAWRDAPFLQAMKNGEWVLLDEMNLASQSVLEGLNACLDHRGEVYVSELDQVFKKHPNFKLFAAQNPHHQGGGRKGLPSSFVNRFIVVYADSLSSEDLNLIACHNFPQIESETVTKIIRFISRLEEEVVIKKAFGAHGGPWEFNLRDTLRWLQLLSTTDPLLSTAKAQDFLNIIIRQRFRTYEDHKQISKLFNEVFSTPPYDHNLYHDIHSSHCQVGLALLERNLLSQPLDFPCLNEISRLPEIESLLICIKQNIPCILSGPSGSGKSILLQQMAAMAGRSLTVFPLNADIDTIDLVGGFEQSDPLREVNLSLQELQQNLQESILRSLPTKSPESALKLLNLLDQYNGETGSLPAIRDCAVAILDQVNASSELGGRITKALNLLNSPLATTDPRFEWLDGVLVKALQKGRWLVLDNANLCSASVLDRLNSLLEPNGVLSINENCGSDGRPRIISPHPDFRIFLTMDPRYGELSRAMRNRAIEIHVNPTSHQIEPHIQSIGPVESSMYRYNSLSRIYEAIVRDNEKSSAESLALETLSMRDLQILARYPSVIMDMQIRDNSSIFLPVQENLGQLLKHSHSDSWIKWNTSWTNMYHSQQEIPPSYQATQVRDDIPNGPKAC
jgi:midasin